MKTIMLTTVLYLAVVVSIAHGAAVVAFGSPADKIAPSGNMISTASGMNTRTGRQQQPLVSNVGNVAENNNEPIFQTQVAAGFPAVFHPGNTHQLKTSGAFSIIDSGVIFWSIAGILGLTVAVWIISLFTGVSFFKTIFSGFSTFKGRADEMGFKMDSQQLNFMANQVYKAIESWRTKNAKTH